MSSNLHVRLPDEMRAYVDLRTGGMQAYATPSEYVRALIRADTEQDAERLYVFRELRQSAQEVAEGRTWSAEDVAERSLAFLAELDRADRR